MALGELKSGMGPDAYAIYQQAVASVMERVHPVGSLYMSASPTSPAELFGGTWEQIKDKFILAAGDTYAAGSTGGEATHTLTENELPVIDGSWRVPVPYFHTTQGVTGHAYGVTFSDEKEYSLGAGEGLSNNYGYGYKFGSGLAHNNMPPYTAMYIWRRVA